MVGSGPLSLLEVLAPCECTMTPGMTCGRRLAVQHSDIGQSTSWPVFMVCSASANMFESPVLAGVSLVVRLVTFDCPT